MYSVLKTTELEDLHSSENNSNRMLIDPFKGVASYLRTDLLMFQYDACFWQSTDEGLFSWFFSMC